MMSGPSHYGKGDRARPFNQQKWDEGYERVFKVLDEKPPPIEETRLLNFQGFPKIPRLNRDIIITEKIDGTNAQVYITPYDRVYAGSRKRWLTPEADNFGFAAWVKEHEQELLELGPGRHFGEWWGQGIQRGYGLDHKRFSLFNVSRWQSPKLMIEYPTRFFLLNRILAPKCCDVIPILGMYPQLDTFYIKGILYELEQKGSLAAPGFMNPEGIVIYHTAGNYLFKVTLENDDKPKGKDNAPRTTR